MHFASRVLARVLTTMVMADAAMGQTPPAAPFPTQPIRLIVPWPAGGTTDVIARLLAQNLTAELEQTVFVENIGGAGGNIGTQAFVRAKPDGHTILMASSSTNAANPHLYTNLGFEPIRDFTPIAMVARVPSVLVVGADSPVRRVEDIVSAEKARPGSLFYASAGVGSSAHLAGELFKELTGIQSVHAPYKGIAPALVDVMSGRVTYTFDTGVTAHVESGKLRPLAVATSRRIAALANVPTFEEAGIKGMQMNVWFGIAGMANMPKSAVSRVGSAINVALRKGELPQRLQKLGSDSQPGTPESFNEFWQSEVARYAEIVRLSGARLD